MKTQETLIQTSEGQVFVKHWIPDQITSEIPLILLHDSLGSVNQWRGFPERLASRLTRPVIAYDRLGFGQSEQSDRPASTDFIEREASVTFLHLSQALNLKQYLLLGHSVGGAIALYVAANNPNCEGVITLSAQAFVEQRTLTGILEAQKAFEDPKVFSKLQKWHDHKANWVLSSWVDSWTNPDFADWELDSVKQVECPVLAIHGDQDEYGSDAFPAYITDHSSGYAQMEIIQGCGHLPHQSHEEVVLSKVVCFVTTQDI